MSGTGVPVGPLGPAAGGRAVLDRIDRLPGVPLPGFDLVVLGVAHFFVFHDITDIGFALPAIVTQFRLSDNDVKFVAIAIGLIGYIAGSFLIGVLADGPGRRLAFLSSLLLYGLGSFATAFATGIVTLSIWRLITAWTWARPSTWPRRMWGSSLRPPSEGQISQDQRPFTGEGLAMTRRLPPVRGGRVLDPTAWLSGVAPDAPKQCRPSGGRGPVVE